MLPNFYSEEQTHGLRKEIEKICKSFVLEDHVKTVFSTTNQTGNSYFLDSGDKIRYFFEEKAFDAAGNLTKPFDKSINKIGHALHALSPVFKAFTHDPRNAAISRQLGLVRPKVAQSMYIFKQPGIGGVVVPHQDSTFLHTAPNSTLGFWVPVERCTTTNGCLWAIPGSHHGGLASQRRMVRSPDGGITFTAPPVEFPEKDFVPLEINAGTLVLLDGNLVHKSDENRSNVSRHAYTWHCIDGSHEYDKLNWLQPSAALPFPDL